MMTRALKDTGKLFIALSINDDQCLRVQKSLASDNHHSYVRVDLDSGFAKIYIWILGSLWEEVFLWTFSLNCDKLWEPTWWWSWWWLWDKQHTFMIVMTTNLCLYNFCILECLRLSGFGLFVFGWLNCSLQNQSEREITITWTITLV